MCRSSSVCQASRRSSESDPSSKPRNVFFCVLSESQSHFDFVSSCFFLLPQFVEILHRGISPTVAVSHIPNDNRVFVCFLNNFVECAKAGFFAPIAFRLTFVVGVDIPFAMDLPSFVRFNCAEAAITNPEAVRGSFRFFVKHNYFSFLLRWYYAATARQIDWFLVRP